MITAAEFRSLFHNGLIKQNAGLVQHAASGRRAGFGEPAADAANQTITVRRRGSFSSSSDESTNLLAGGT